MDSGSQVRLTAADGHRLDAYDVHPDGASASIVVVQEIFGVNAHIGSMVDRVPAVPTMLHFGELDADVPLDHVHAIDAAHPDVSVHVDEGAEHGFWCGALPAAIAWGRTPVSLVTNGLTP